MGKGALYANTIRYLKLEQLWYQVTKRIGMSSPLIKGYVPALDLNSIKLLPAITELDYDAEFLARFYVKELMCDEITLLHSTESLDLNGSWFFEKRSPLWNHNLHYFEYLFALARQFEVSGKEKYFNKIKEYITTWIKHNPIGSKNSAWECYPIALRLPNWIDLYDLLQEQVENDIAFKELFIKSLFDQYGYLLNHLERHLLANHYFEDLKALVIASSFFGDEKVREIATEKLLKQCNEQIFEDGMQYERSPMYQKILLEDLIRVEVALESLGRQNESIREYIQKMLDVAFSLEIGLERLPLFNDCGKNITKSLTALTEACKKRLGIKPCKKFSFPNSGFYIFEIDKRWKLIIDGGQPGPDYSPGHAHCEMMSFELFHEGKPVLVNCGTYAYQCDQRDFFKSTSASNTVKVADTEQSECWSTFRMARRARLERVDVNTDRITIRMYDYKKNEIQRQILIGDKCISIKDMTKNNSIKSYIHVANKEYLVRVNVLRGNYSNKKMPYSEEFGNKREIDVIEISSERFLEYNIDLK